MTEEELKRAQPALYSLLKRGFERDSMPQALLLYSSPRCAFRTLVRYIAQSLSCSSGGFADNSCTECRRFLSGTHPDYIEIDGADANIKKDQIAQLRDFFSMSSVENRTRRRAYAIVDCQSMTEEAANALLKFLEEPAPGITALLTAPSVEVVLPTIVSRCQLVRIDPVSREDIFRSMSDSVGPEVAYFLSDISGDKDRLDAVGQDEDFKLAAELAADFISSLLEGRAQASYSLLSAATKGAGRPRCYNFFYGDVSRFISDALAQDGLFGPFASAIERFGQTEPDLASRMELSLRESMSMARANLSFTGVLAQLAELLIG